MPYMKGRDELLGSGEELRFFINRTLKTQAFRGREVVAALPPNKFQLLHINYQVHKNDDHDAMLVRAVKERFSERLGNAVIDYLPIRPKVDDQVDRTALVAISDHEELVDFLEALRRAKLKVKALEVGSVAIQRLLSSLQKQDNHQSKLMAINFASDRTFVTVIWGGELLLDREIPVGLDSMLGAICSSLGMTEDKVVQMLEHYGLSEYDSQFNLGKDLNPNEDISSSLSQILSPSFQKLTKEIKKILIFTAAETQGGAIEAVYLLGSAARWPNSDKYLSRHIKLPVVTLDPLIGHSPKSGELRKDKLEPISGLSVASGLALRGLVNNA